MNRIEITAGEPCEIVLNGGICYRSLPAAKPDRVSIALTEREAELVYDLANKGPHGHITAVWRTFSDGDVVANKYADSNFDWTSFPNCQSYGPESAYAHAKRTYDDIRLTMDREVAVTLKHLLMCVRVGDTLDPRKLAPVHHKLNDAGVYYSAPGRFTGSIRWKKPHLKAPDLDIGKAYKLVGRGRFGAADYEWEPVE